MTKTQFHPKIEAKLKELKVRTRFLHNVEASTNTPGETYRRLCTTYSSMEAIEQYYKDNTDLLNVCGVTEEEMFYAFINCSFTWSDSNEGKDSGFTGHEFWKCVANGRKPKML